MQCRYSDGGWLPPSKRLYVLKLVMHKHLQMYVREHSKEDVRVPFAPFVHRPYLRFARFWMVCCEQMPRAVAKSKPHPAALTLCKISRKSSSNSSSSGGGNSNSDSDSSSSSRAAACKDAGASPAPFGHWSYLRITSGYGWHAANECRIQSHSRCLGAAAAAAAR